MTPDQNASAPPRMRIVQGNARALADQLVARFPVHEVPERATVHAASPVAALRAVAGYLIGFACWATGIVCALVLIAWLLGAFTSSSAGPGLVRVDGTTVVDVQRAVDAAQGR